MWELPEWLDRWTIGGAAGTTALAQFIWRRLARPSVSPGLLPRFVSWCLTIPGRELENARLQEDKRRLERLLTIATALNDQHISTLEKVAGIGSVSGTNGKPGGTLTSTPPSSSSKLNGPTTSLK